MTEHTLAISSAPIVQLIRSELHGIHFNVGDTVIINGRIYEVVSHEASHDRTILDIKTEATKVLTHARGAEVKPKQQPHYAKYNDWRKKARR